MNTFLYIKEEEIDLSAMDEVVKKEELAGIQNFRNLNDAEYLNVSNNLQNKLVENWKTLTWKCSYCNHIDSSYEILLIHLKSMHQISDIEGVHYQCNDCEESKLNYASFLNHVRCGHYEILKLCCDICNDFFLNFEELAKHRKEHIELLRNLYPDVYHCFLCEKVRTTEKELKMHTQLFHSSLYSEETQHRLASDSSQNSTEDGNSIASSIYVKDEYHETEQIFQCSFCVKTFFNESDLLTHENIHSGNKRVHNCETCSKSFNSQYSLKIHIRAHTGERPYKCETCLKSFFQKIHLKSHLHTHNKDRALTINTFNCEICSKSFIKKALLKSHLLSHSEKRPIKCQYCEKFFKSKGQKDRHISSHTRERPYKCEACSKSFMRKSHLNDHIVVHTDERPFKCEICPKSFPRKMQLKSHQLIHTKERPFKCELCEKSFKSKKNRKAHMNHVHGVFENL